MQFVLFYSCYSCGDGNVYICNNMHKYCMIYAKDFIDIGVRLWLCLLIIASREASEARTCGRGGVLQP